MKSNIKYLFAGALMVAGLTSCVGDLDIEKPLDPNLTTADKIQAEWSLNKCYGSLALAGQGGADGDSDINGIDGGTSGYFRQLWNSQELVTDEAICGWGDDGIETFAYNTYDAAHPMLRAFYYRLYTNITFCNQYLIDFSDYDATMTAEVRFLRAMLYFNLMDAFGNVPFTTDITTALPKQYTRAQVYEFVEKELLDIENKLSEPKAKKSTDAGYGRVDKAAAWLLLARLYLNAEVYTGKAEWNKAAEYAEKVMTSDYKLNKQGKNGWSAYQMLFMGDNGETDAAYEAILPLLQDGLTTTSWGTALYLVGGCADGKAHANPNDLEATNGTNASWSGHRVRSSLLQKFFPNLDAPEVPSYTMVSVAGDDRAIFDGGDGGVTVKRTITNEEQGTFTSGYCTNKFVNFKTDGTPGHDSQHPDMDVFLLRKAEAYLTYAEAQARTNGGKTTTKAAEAINELRTRAHAATQETYTLDEILDEWSREFYFEGRRRTDLVRFGKFGGNTNYNWPWKGGTFAGRNFDAYRNIYAIPTSDLIANTNLKQNEGYK